MQPILKVDLSSKTISQFSVPVEWERDFLGGSALAARLLYDKLTPDLEPFAPQAPLLFLNGPLSGTAGPAIGRFVVCGRSPATGLWGESNCGGFWGPELRMAGFDGLWVEGQSDQPVYLWIQDGKVEIRPAEHLWGLDTYQTQAAVENELGAGKVRVASIGIAGEACLPFALILCDHGRVAGRTGMGAVMGKKRSKRWQCRGMAKSRWPTWRLTPACARRPTACCASDGQTQVLRELGTAGAADYFDYLGEMPKRYFQQRRAGRRAAHLRGGSQGYHPGRGQRLPCLRDRLRAGGAPGGRRKAQRPGIRDAGRLWPQPDAQRPGPGDPAGRAVRPLWHG